MSFLSLLCLLIGVVVVPTRAQSVDSSRKFQRLPIERDPGIAKVVGQPQILFFNTRTDGFVHIQRAGDYRTFDGGDTWVPHEGAKVHFPKLFAGGFGLSGSVATYDSGRTWQSYTTSFGEAAIDDALHQNGLVIASVAASTRHYILLVRPQITYYDSSRGGNVNPHLVRTGYTRDSGATWTLADSIVVRQRPGGARASIHRLTHFGLLPAPPEFTNPEFGWQEIIDSDTAGVWVVTYAQETDTDVIPAPVRYYVGRVRFSGGATEWHQLPVINQPDSTGYVPRVSDFVMPRPGVLYMLDRHQAGNSQIIRGIWRSLDSGRTWDHRSVPDWVDVSRTQFVTATRLVTTNGISDDGGRSWRRIASEFRSNITNFDYLEGRMFALDSAHLFFMTTHGVLARSSDGGLTWRRNGGGSDVYSLASNRGVVLAGRKLHSLMRSDDAGENWQEIVHTDSVLVDLNTVWGLAFPDPTNQPDLVVGLAGFLTGDGVGSVSVIESRDAGISWKRTQSLPITALTGALQFGRNNSDGRRRGFLINRERLYTSEDDGATWQERQHLGYSRSRLHVGSADNVLIETRENFDTPWELSYSTNGGETWAKSLPLARPYANPVGIHTLSATEYLYLVSEQEVNDRTPLTLYRSTDGGRRWTEVRRSSIPGGSSTFMQAIWIDTTELYVVAPRGICHSTDGGATFTEAEADVFEGQFSRDDQFIYNFADYNRFSRRALDAKPAAVTIRNPELMASAALHSSVTGGSAIIRLQLPGLSRVRIQIVDVTGRTEYLQDFGSRAPGVHDLPIDLGKLAVGVHFIRIETGGPVITLKHVITH